MKFVAVLNKSIEIPRLMNALGHVTIGLARQLESDVEAGLVTYVDSEGNRFPHISQYPFIVLDTNSSKLKAFHEALNQENIRHTTFLDTMIEGGSDQQVERTKERKFEELIFYAIAAFGEKAKLDPLTKKFSLFK